MANDIMIAIKQAEEQAQLLLQDAHQSANEIIKNAETQAAQAEREAAISSRDLFAQLLKEREDQVQQKLQASQGPQGAQQVEELSQANKLLQDAVSYIVQEVLHGNR